MAFGTALIAGHRIAAYVSLLAGYVGFLWLTALVNDQPAPSAWAAVGLAAWLLFLLAASELIRNRRAFALARYEAARRQASEERLGIARDLHDVVAHSLSLINVQASVALELMEQRPEQVRTALTAIKHASREALVDVQSVLDSLRRPGEEMPRAPAPSLRDVGELVRRAEATGLAVDVRATPRALPRGVDAVTAAAGSPRVQDPAQYRASATSGVNTVLGLVYVMLALAIVIALMGVANTLSLSIHERTRELGLLRALGQTRAQARGMIRWESVIIAVFETAGGVILGQASYFSASIGGRLIPDIAWSYPDPRHDAERVRDLIAFFDERIDVILDGERRARPVTPWS